MPDHPLTADEAEAAYAEGDALALEIVRLLQGHATYICCMALARAYGCLFADINAMIETDLNVGLDIFKKEARESFARHRALYVAGPKGVA